MEIVIKTISYVFACGYSEPSQDNKEDVLYLECTKK